MNRAFKTNWSKGSTSSKSSRDKLLHQGSAEMHANVKALKNAATSAPAPKWFVAQPWAVLQIPKREFPRLAPPPTAAQQLEYFRRSSPNESKLKLETGPHADAVVGPTVAAREILRWRIKVVDCDAGELSLKVTCAPL